MSQQLAVAEATPDRTPIPVIAREVFLEGPVVKIRVPKEVYYEGSYEENDRRIAYQQFAVSVRGGLVNCFVHADKSCRGQLIAGQATVMKKLLEDGREFVYIDIVPVPAETEVTHRLAVMTHKDEFDNHDDWKVIRTPEPIKGAIIFAPLGAKIVTTRKKEVLADPRRRPEPKGPVMTITLSGPERTTHNSQVERLLDQGWKLSHETDEAWHLRRWTSEHDMKEMIQHKPRPKVTNKKPGRR